MSLILTRSSALRRRAEKLFPGGVNSPVRAFRAVGGEPPFVERGEGAYLWDADGNRYIDYFGSWGPMILGHAFPPVVEAIQQAAARSASFGASTAGRRRSRRAGRRRLPLHRKNALRQLRHRSHHVRHPPRPRLHRTANSSSSSKAAITATPTACWSKPAPASPPSASPAPQAFRKKSPTSPSPLPYNDVAAVEVAFEHIRSRSPPSSSSPSSATRAASRPRPATSKPCARSPRSTARCSSSTKS